MVNNPYYIKQQIEVAKKAVERYAKGELTPLEIQLGCDSKKLALTWNETLFRLRGVLEKIETK